MSGGGPRREGITASEFEGRFGVRLEEGERGTVRLTTRGRLLGNQAFVRFVEWEGEDGRRTGGLLSRRT